METLKSTESHLKQRIQSRRTPIYYVDLVIKEGVSLQQAVSHRILA
jgi:hypothetical protein